MITTAAFDWNLELADTKKTSHISARGIFYLHIITYSLINIPFRPYQEHHENEVLLL